MTRNQERFNAEEATQYAIVPEMTNGEWMTADFAPTFRLAKATADEMLEDEYNDGTYKIAIVYIFEAAGYEILSQYDAVHQVGERAVCERCGGFGGQGHCS